MTATLIPAVVGPALTNDVWTIGNPRLLAGLDQHANLDLTAHLAIHGPLPATDEAHLLALLDAARLAGRGGGFPFAAKLRALSGKRRTVVVNGSESEPASHKDRTLLRRSPHLVLDGALAVAAAIQAGRVVVTVHDWVTAAAVERAVSERSDARAVTLHRVDSAVGTTSFVAGEARAIVRAIEGGPALPSGRRQHATAKGTLLSNVETFAQVAVVLRIGAHRFISTGTYDEPGTTLLTISGAVTHPGVVEIPIGTPLGIVLAAAGAAAEPAAVITGGYHGTWVAPDPALVMSRAGLTAAGAAFGAGVMIVVDHSTCSLGELGRAAAWLAAESARQCGPCVFGLPALAADVASICRGDARGIDAAARHARAVDGRGACSHPDGTARFVSSGLRLLREEVQAHLNGGCGRPVRGLLPIGGTSS